MTCGEGVLHVRTALGLEEAAVAWPGCDLTSTTLVPNKNRGGSKEGCQMVSPRLDERRGSKMSFFE